MAINYVYLGNPMEGTVGDDFMIGYEGSTGTNTNTINGNDGDDYILADSSNTWLPNASWNNDSIVNAFTFEGTPATWTTDENPLFGNSNTPHTTAMAEATVGQAEYYAVAIGAGETITIDIDFGDYSAIGVNGDTYVELLNGAGTVIASSDDSATTDGGLGSFAFNGSGTYAHDSFLTFTVASAGTYFIRVRPFGADTFSTATTYLLNLSVTGHAVGTNSVMGADTVNGGAGDDSIFGQGGADLLNGGIGNDLIHGGTGVDTINGGDGDDTLYGGETTEETVHGDAGNDRLYSGGEGHYYGDAGNDVVYAGLTGAVAEVLDGGDGTDTLDVTTWDGTYSIDMSTGVTNYNESFINFENLITGNGADTIIGTATGNSISTQAGIDNVSAGDGNDFVNGGAEGDTLDGGNGVDFIDYRDSSAALVISLLANTASGGYADGDTISNFENVFGSTFADSITGNGVANDLRGYYGDDSLFGLDGNDRLDGGVGVDTMTGGDGNDTYIVDNTGDLAVESSATGGIDTVRSEVSYTLGARVENMVLTGTGNIDATGNSLNNTLYGNSGANTLNGGTGADQMRGGGGDDVYYCDNIGDRGIETASASGYDIVRTSVSMILGTNVERMIMSGSNNINGTGNASDNLMSGNDGDNNIVARGGNDTVYGGAGIDRIYGEAGDDILHGEAGNDWLEGGAGLDRYYGDAGSDYFVFRNGDFNGNTAATADRIVDFSHADADHIRLNYADANTIAGGDQAFSFIGANAFTHVAGQLRYEQISGNTYVSGDTNGDGNADFMIRVDGLHAFVSGDFVL